jgi:adenosine deaminase
LIRIETSAIDVQPLGFSIAEWRGFMLNGIDGAWTDEATRQAWRAAWSAAWSAEFDGLVAALPD